MMYTQVHCTAVLSLWSLASNTTQVQCQDQPLHKPDTSSGHLTPGHLACHTRTVEGSTQVSSAEDNRIICLRELHQSDTRRLLCAVRFAVAVRLCLTNNSSVLVSSKNLAARANMQCSPATMAMTMFGNHDLMGILALLLLLFALLLSLRTVSKGATWE